MPYKRKGRVVYMKEGDSWKKKATAKTAASAGRMINLLRAVKAGYKPKKRKKRRGK